MGRYCVIGAGPSGLSAARALALAGLELDLLDRHSRIGGLWDLGNLGTPMYRTAHVITSREMTGFVGFPLECDVDYPARSVIESYLRDFADAFDLNRSFQGGVEVSRVAPRDGRWEVSLANEPPRLYDGVVAAPGFQWIRHAPKNGLDGFTGEVMHAADYRGPEDVCGRRVLVIGGGNSAADIVVDAAHVATHTCWSFHRGRWFIPKYLDGKPSDVPTSKRERMTALAEQQELARTLIANVGPCELYGLPAPDHLPLERVPIIGTHVLHYITHGDVSVRGGVRSCDGDRVVFDDDRDLICDLIVLATGYVDAIPFLTGVDATWPQFVLNAMHRSARGLCVVGNLNSELGGFWIADLVSALIAQILKKLQNGTPWPDIQKAMACVPNDLTGGGRFASMPGKSLTVHGETFLKALLGLGKRLGCELELPAPWRTAL